MILMLPMSRLKSQPKLVKEGTVQGFALLALLLMGGMALAGPSGLLAWGENQRMLEQRRIEVKQLSAQRDELKNRVGLLDPRHTDPDLAGELVRRNLNVVHPDEMVMLLK